MLKRANSPRRASVRPHRAYLLAEYSDQAGMARRPHIEATLTMAGCVAVRQDWNSGADQLGRSEEVDFHDLPHDFFGRIGKVSPACDAGIVDEHVQPAELLARPRRAAAADPRCASRRSARPARRQAQTVWRLPAVCPRSARPGRGVAPCCASCSARRRPMPLEAPVMRMRRFCRFLFMWFFVRFGSGKQRLSERLPYFSYPSVFLDPTKVHQCERPNLAKIPRKSL